MDMQEKVEKTIIARLKEFPNQFDLVGIYRNHETEKAFKTQMDPWATSRHEIYPVAWNREVKEVGSTGQDDSAALFFGTKFLWEPEFLLRVVQTLEVHGYDPSKMKVYFYKILK